MAGKKRPYKTYTKADIAEMIASELNLSERRAYSYINDIFKYINNILCEANPEARIEIRGFGMFEIVKAAAKPAGRNPKTNEVV